MAEQAKALELQCAHLKQDRAAQLKQREHEKRELEREAQDQARKLLEAEQEKHQWQRKAQDWEQELKAREREILRLQEELKRREADVSQQSCHPCRAAQEAQVSHGLGGNRHSSAIKDDPLGRGSAAIRHPSAGVARRLFAQASTQPPDGARTPPHPQLHGTPCGTPQRLVPAPGGSVCAPTAGAPLHPVSTAIASVPNSSIMPTMPTPTAMPQAPLSARYNSSIVVGPGAAIGQPPRPSPRTGGQVWTSTSSGAATVNVPSSPHPRFQSHDRSEERAQQVRALVSAFERRSNSATPHGGSGAMPSGRNHMADASPSRHVVYASSALSRPATGSSSRAGSALSLHRRGRPAEVTEAEVAAGGIRADDSTSAVNFGMSPLPQRHVHVTRAAVASLSPQSKAPVSVQDRIRQLNGGRFGR